MRKTLLTTVVLLISVPIAFELSDRFYQYRLTNKEEKDMRLTYQGCCQVQDNMIVLQSPRSQNKVIESGKYCKDDKKIIDKRVFIRQDTCFETYFSKSEEKNLSMVIGRDNGPEIRVIKMKRDDECECPKYLEIQIRNGNEGVAYYDTNLDGIIDGVAIVKKGQPRRLFTSHDRKWVRDAQ